MQAFKTTGDDDAQNDPTKPSGSGQKMHLPDTEGPLQDIGDFLKKKEMDFAKTKPQTKEAIEKEKAAKEKWLADHGMKQETICPACGTVAATCPYCYIEGCPLFV